MVSMIQSNFRGFGSGIVVPGTSISLNDRAENFKFDPNHVNALEGGKRPPHDHPAFLTKDGDAVGPFGIMGGWMQPQAHVQVVQNMIDWHLNPQQALDARVGSGWAAKTSKWSRTRRTTSCVCCSVAVTTSSFSPTPTTWVAAR